jgi:hypothetical protein
MNPIVLTPNTPEQVKLIKQLAKTLNIKASVIKETPTQKRERELLESIDRAAKEVKAHLRGDIKLQSAEDFLNEL